MRKKPGRDHVYHPDFGGSFSIKDVLPALIPGLGYDDLEIQNGGSASTALEVLLLDADAFSLSERKALRSQGPELGGHKARMGAR